MIFREKALAIFSQLPDGRRFASNPVVQRNDLQEVLSKTRESCLCHWNFCFRTSRSVAATISNEMIATKPTPARNSGDV